MSAPVGEMTNSQRFAAENPDSAARLVLNPQADQRNAWAVLCTALGYVKAIDALMEQGAEPDFLITLPRYEQGE